MTDFDPYAYASSQPAAQQQAFDPYAYAANPPVIAQNSSAAAPTPLPKSYSPGEFINGAVIQTAAGMAAPAIGGWRGLWDIALGRGAARASADIASTEQAMQPTARDTAQKAGMDVAQSEWNPLNWPGIALTKSGQFLGDTAERMGAPPIVSAALTAAPTAAAALVGLAKEPYEPEVESATPSATTTEPAVIEASETPPDVAPVEGGMPQGAQDARAQILNRVGIQNARQSAIEGNAKDAATDYQMTKYDQPAGRAAAAQFDAERNALASHTEGIIQQTGGTVGMDEDALSNRGQTIAKPFDSMRQWFDQRTKQLYADAQARSDQLAANGNPTAYTQLQSVDRMLSDPTFRNTLLAKDQGNLLQAVQSQLQEFRRSNPNGFTPAAAEQFRQWLNQIWSPDNRNAVGQLKDSVDNDVTQTAGQDLFAQARAMHALRSRTLDNPNGISQLFDVDPMTPINRTTPFERIPDRLTNLPIEQYQNVLDTLKGMPPELQGQAQAALGEIRGHLANKLLQAGTQTKAGNGAALWGADRVATTLGNNAAKFRIAFQDDPQGMAAIRNLNSAGQILKVDASYPGADAQAANAMKRGLLSRSLGHLGEAAGGATGAIAGPLGAGIGAVSGRMGGEAIAGAAAERAALKAWGKRMRSTEGAH